MKSEEGRGTTFWFTLPYVTGKPCETPCGEIPTVSVEKDKLTILIAEDNDSNYMLVKVLLKGYNLTRACTGREAVELAGREKFDIILMDIRMPVMDGLEATKAIRELEREDAKKIPIIAMTANAFEEDRKACLDAGMDEHIGKPIDIPLLKSAIIKLLAKS